MKKHLSLLVILTMIFAVIALASCGTTQNYQEQIDALKEENRILTEQIADLSEAMEELYKVNGDQNKAMVELMKSLVALENWNTASPAVFEKVREAEEILNYYWSLPSDIEIKNQLSNIYNNYCFLIVRAISVEEMDQLLVEMEATMKQLVEEQN